ncbi:Taurine catabolism dioxygenase TauD/TfdA [Ilyonectria robusta]
MTALELENIALIDPVNFPLPLGLANKLRSISSTIHSGRGFAVLRGLKLDDRPDEDCVIAFCGVSSYIGKDRCTNDNGVAMHHLRDAARDEKPAGREHIELHPSKMMAPLQDGRVLCQVVHRIFEGTNLLSPVQRKALDLLETFANKNSIKLDVEVGDIQLVNNLALLHARRAWVDRPGQERHYYRLGLRDPGNYWKRPLKYEAVFDDHFHTAPEEQSIPVSDFDPYGLTSLAHHPHG